MPAVGERTGRELWKAGDLARETGLTRQSLHQYVVLGLLDPLDWTKGGQRLFEPVAAIDRINLIQNMMNVNGYTLQEMRVIFFKRQQKKPRD